MKFGDIVICDLSWYGSGPKEEAVIAGTLPCCSTIHLLVYEDRPNIIGMTVGEHCLTETGRTNHRFAANCRERYLSKFPGSII